MESKGLAIKGQRETDTNRTDARLGRKKGTPPLEAAGRQVNAMTFARVDVLNSFSFGPSQEDDGQRKRPIRWKVLAWASIPFVQFTLNG